MLMFEMGEPPTSLPVTTKSVEFRLVLLSTQPAEKVFVPFAATSTCEKSLNAFSENATVVSMLPRTTSRSQSPPSAVLPVGLLDAATSRPVCSWMLSSSASPSGLAAISQP